MGTEGRDDIQPLSSPPPPRPQQLATTFLAHPHVKFLHFSKVPIFFKSSLLSLQSLFHVCPPLNCHPLERRSMSGCTTTKQLKRTRSIIQRNNRRPQKHQRSKQKYLKGHYAHISFSYGETRRKWRLQRTKILIFLINMEIFRFFFMVNPNIEE